MWLTKDIIDTRFNNGKFLNYKKKTCVHRALLYIITQKLSVIKPCIYAIFRSPHYTLTSCMKTNLFRRDPIFHIISGVHVI